MGISKVTRNCQITLPKDIRKVIGVQEGDEVMFVINENRVSLVKSAEDPVIAAAGIWKDLKETGAHYQKRMREQWKKRRKRTDW